MDNTYLQTAIDNDVLWQHFANVSNISEKALTAYDGPLAVPFDQGYMCLNYDTEVVDGVNLSVPTTLWDLTQEEWRGKVAILPPETSSPGRAFMTATVDYFANDEDNQTDWRNWWTAMASNDAIVTSGWTEAYVTHYTGGYGEYIEGYVGDAHMVVSYCHSQESSRGTMTTGQNLLLLIYRGPLSTKLNMQVPYKEETWVLHQNSSSTFSLKM